jgi:hypothetical protein
MAIIRNNQKHGFHLVDPSPWPLISAFGALNLTFGGVLYMHGYSGGSFLMKFGFIMILFMMYVWWRDVIREATIEGQHTNSVQSGLRMGVLLFIVSEIMFFHIRIKRMSSPYSDKILFTSSVSPPTNGS